MRKPVMRRLHSAPGGCIGRLWPLEAERKRLFRDVFEDDIVGNNVVVQMLVDHLTGFRRGVDKKVVLEAKDVRVGQNASLRIEEENVYSVTGLHLLHVIRGHSVQEASAIFARNPDPSTT